MSRPSFATEAWASLAADGDDEMPVFDPSTLHGLPTPARRYLARALPDGVPLSSTVELEMDGAIKIGGRWLRFTADQILRADVAFVWAPVVGGTILRFVGADALTPHDASLGALPWVWACVPDAASVKTASALARGSVVSAGRCRCRSR